MVTGAVQKEGIQITLLKKVGMFSAPILFLVVFLIPAPANLDLPAWRTAAVGLLMAVLWITEAIPIPITALLPIVLFPLLNIAPIKVASAPYAHPLIF